MIECFGVKTVPIKKDFAAINYFVPISKIAGPHLALTYEIAAVTREYAIKGLNITAPYANAGVSEMASEMEAKAPAAERAAVKLLPKDFPGGIKSPHVHYNGDIYLLKKEDWKAFSGKIIEDFRAKLANAKNVSYDELMRLSEAMQDIT